MPKLFFYWQDKLKLFLNFKFTISSLFTFRPKYSTSTSLFSIVTLPRHSTYTHSACFKYAVLFSYITSPAMDVNQLSRSAELQTIILLLIFIQRFPAYKCLHKHFSFVYVIHIQTVLHLLKIRIIHVAERIGPALHKSY